MSSTADLETVPVGWLTDVVAGVFAAVGFSADAAGRVAEALVAADMRGIPSHGVMLVPMYVARLRAGSVSLREEAETVCDLGAVAVLDAGHALGQLSGDHAMRLAVHKAGRYGVGLVTVRHAFHFGGAFRYVQAAADAGCIGVAAANTRPLMPAPGGASPVVGNNPLAIGIPRRDGEPVVFDIALSEAALGKVRLAASERRAIPDTWATDHQGRPTTDPVAAIDGLLLPAGGHKGFGLAFMIDVLTGVLSGGGYGHHVKGLYVDTSVPNDCAHLFMAIDVAACGDVEAFERRLADLTAQVRGSDLAQGTERVHLPGEIEASRYARAQRHGVALAPSVLADLRAAAAELDVAVGVPDGAVQAPARKERPCT